MNRAPHARKKLQHPIVADGVDLGFRAADGSDPARCFVTE